MKKLLVLLMAVGLIMSTATVMANGVPEFPQDANVICKAIDDSIGLGEHNLGQCTSFLATLTNNGNAEEVAICRVIVAHFDCFDNRGQCVSFLRAIQKD